MFNLVPIIPDSHFSLLFVEHIQIVDVVTVRFRHYVDVEIVEVACRPQHISEIVDSEIHSLTRAHLKP